MAENKLAKKKISYNFELSLNKSSYKKLSPKDKDYFVRDKKLEGFWIRCYPSGKTSYGCYARKGGVGRQIPITIGDCKVWNFEEAKEKARQTIQQIKYEGINPKTIIKQESTKNKTLIDLAHDYFKANKKLKDSTKDDYIRRLNNRMPSLIKLPVTEITLEEILDWWYNCPAKSSDRTAFIYARKLLAQAAAKRYVLENNFNRAKEIIGDLPEIKSREADHISKDDMYDFFQAFLEASPAHGKRPKKGKQMSFVMRDYLLFTLITGKRRDESMSLKWKNVDFKKGIITLDKTKFSKVDVIPMTNTLFIMLNYRFNMTGDTNATRKHPIWVFPSRNGESHIKNPDKALSQLRKRTDLNFNLSSHDFRRTFSTATLELGLSKRELSILLNHAKKDATDGYVQASAEYKRSNAELVSAYYNQHSGNALNEMSVKWYQANSKLFSDEDKTTPKQKMDFGTSRLYLLGEYQDDFEGIGSEVKWKPNDRLIQQGWIDEEN
jgi:integrase